MTRWPSGTCNACVDALKINLHTHSPGRAEPSLPIVCSSPGGRHLNTNLYGIYDTNSGADGGLENALVDYLLIYGLAWLEATANSCFIA